MSLSQLLKKVAETHHMVWMKQDGVDPDWPMWYANWLVDHSDFLQVLGTEMTKSELICKLLELDKQFVAKSDNTSSWQDFYAKELESIDD